MYPKPQTDYDLTGLSMPNALHAMMRFPGDGEYTFRVALEGRRPNGSEPVHIAIWIDGKQVSTLDIDAPSDGGSIDLFGAQAETKIHIPAGDHWVAASLLRLYEGLPPSYGGPNPSKRPIPPGRDPMRGVKIPEGATPEQIAETQSPSRETGRAVQSARQSRLGSFRRSARTVQCDTRIADRDPQTNLHLRPCDRPASAGLRAEDPLPICPPSIPTTRHCNRTEALPGLSGFARKQQGSNFDEAIGAGLQAILVSPDFLFRIEQNEPNKKPSESDVRPISQFALASRLSYFLWSSMPDEELLRAAESGFVT